MSFKTEIAKERFFLLHPIAQHILCDAQLWCWMEGLRFQVTETVTTLEEDELIGRKSATHRTGRAFDMSIKGWPDTTIHRFINRFSDRYEHLAAVNEEGSPVLIPPVDHGTAPHIHVQIHAKYALDLSGVL